MPKSAPPPPVYPNVAASWVLLCAGLAIGESRISGLGTGVDAVGLIAALRSLGASARQEADGSWVIAGQGVGALTEPAGVIAVGGDRWQLAALAGLLGSHPVFAVLAGSAGAANDLPLVLRALGARVQQPASGGMPLAIAGARDAVPIEISLATGEADTAVTALVAGLNARGITRIAFAGDDLPCRFAQGIAVLRRFGAEISDTIEDGHRIIRLRGQPDLRCQDIAIAVPLVIAVDGPAAAGKGTLARRLAIEFGLPYLDTGLLYRAVARLVIDTGGDPADPAAAIAAVRRLRPEDTGRGDLRGPPVDLAASRVAAHPDVRAALLDFQRAFAHAKGGVLDGRDIGTVIFPDAPIKFFVTASTAARGRRRWLELVGRGVAADIDAVTDDLRQRDVADAARAAAPMVAAADAIALDTTDIDAEAAFAVAVDRVRARLAQR